MKTNLTGWAAAHVASVRRQGGSTADEYIARINEAEGFFHGRNCDVIHRIGGCGGRRSSYLSPLSAAEVASSIERGARWCGKCAA